MQDDDGYKRFLTLKAFCQRYSCGRTKAHQEIKIGRLKKSKIGRATRIHVDDAEAWARLCRGEE